MKNALLVLEDGSQFYGQSIGTYGESVGEIIFNTSMTGYQEIITDPSYAQQIVILTHPHIGNVGINDFDNESSQIQVAGLIICNLTIISSNFRSTESLSNCLIRQNIVGISNIDTRKLTRLIRTKGIQRACIMTHDQLNPDLALSKACAFPGSSKLKLAYKVSTNKQYIWSQGSYFSFVQYKDCVNLLSSADPKRSLYYHIVVYDFGVKYNIMRMLVDYGCLLTVIPANTDAQQVIDMKPDGIFLSNGPGDPNEYQDAVDIIHSLLFTTNIPIFGVCLGYQLLALAGGSKTEKMKFGHHGSNHPVKDLETGKVMITAQNHNFIIDIATLPKILKATHISLFDGTLQGIRYIDRPALGFQGHPEASPGPHDAKSIFNNFIKLVKNYHNKNK